MANEIGLRAGPRQREILELLASGMSDAQVALHLKISIATVRTYLDRLYRENGFNNRTQAVAAWLQSMTLSSPPDGVESSTSQVQSRTRPFVKRG